jgi:hypothetical protein
LLGRIPNYSSSFYNKHYLIHNSNNKHYLVEILIISMVGP